MAQKQDKVTDMLCAAIQMEEKEEEFFHKAADECPNELGKEIFLAILKDETEHKKGIQGIREAIKTQEGWSAACSLYGRKQMDAKETFSRIARRYAPSIKAVAGVTDALQIAIELEKAAMDFYAGYLKDAGSQAEMTFLQTMLSEERSHHGILLDMQYYFQNPEGYFMEKERSGLDGA